LRDNQGGNATKPGRTDDSGPAARAARLFVRRRPCAACGTGADPAGDGRLHYHAVSAVGQSAVSGRVPDRASPLGGALG
jgi:hypothetical protein